MYDSPQNQGEDGEQYFGLTPGQLNGAFLALVGGGIASVCAWLFAFGGMDSVSGIWGGGEEGYRETTSSLGISHTPQQAADAAVLTPADMPGGWAIAPPEEDEDSDLELSEQCQALDQDGWGGEIATASSSKLKGPYRQSVNSDASVFASPEEAQGVLDRYNGLLSLCKDEVMAAFNAGFRHGVEQDGVDPSLVQAEILWQDMPPPGVGESGLAFRIYGTVTGPAGSFAFGADFMAFREGRVVGGLVYSTIGDAPAGERDQLAGIAAGKLRQANSSLS